MQDGNANENVTWKYNSLFHLCYLEITLTRFYFYTNTKLARNETGKSGS